jgi:hypothetical protein
MSPTCVIVMRERLKTETISWANGFLLLTTVVAVLNIDLFGLEAASGNRDPQFNYRIELVFDAKESDAISAALSITENIYSDAVPEACVILPYFYRPRFVATLSAIHINGQANVRPFYSSCGYTTFFNIPHQNSDEEDAFILQVDVA